jgi:hypothetical protein
MGIEISIVRGQKWVSGFTFFSTSPNDPRDCVLPPALPKSLARVIIRKVAEGAFRGRLPGGLRWHRD